MDRTELTAAIAAALLAAMALGWLMAIVAGRLNGPTRAARLRMAVLEADLADARAQIEELRAASQALLQDRETRSGD